MLYFAEKKNAGNRTAGLAQGSGSLVVRSTARTQIFYKFQNCSLKCLGSSGMCLGGLRRSLGTTFVENILKNIMVQKVSRKVQQGPRSLPDPLENYVLPVKSL